MIAKRKPGILSKAKISKKTNSKSTLKEPRVVDAIKTYNDKPSGDNLYELINIIVKEKIKDEHLKSFFKTLKSDLSKVTESQFDNIRMMYEVEINKIQKKIRKIQNTENEAFPGQGKLEENNVRVLKDSLKFIETEINKIRPNTQRSNVIIGDQRTKNETPKSQSVVAEKSSSTKHQNLSKLQKFMYETSSAKVEKIKKLATKTFSSPVPHRSGNRHH